MQEPPLVTRARLHGSRPAIREGERVFTYAHLLDASARVAATLLHGRPDLAEARIAFMAPAGFEYAAVQWGIWRAGGIAIPLSVHATPPELDHALGDSDAEAVVVSREYLSHVEGQGRSVILADEAMRGETAPLPEITADRRAMILYTSGTTSKPKGVVSTHSNLEAQVTALIEAWEWQADDRIPLFLPLHHIHGIINVLGCALWSGALVEAFPRFDTRIVLPRVAEGAYTLFMAVPTIYAKLTSLLEKPSPENDAIILGFAGLRLMVSGSAALPASLHQRWAELTGQVLLERYGMTETGMMISNPLHGERRSGSVGQPLPGVEIRLRDENGGIIGNDGEPGEIQSRGPAIFSDYWHRPEATAESFEDGWFRTGDMGVRESGYYRILGRLSVDIIKSGGYKLSALEIEAALLDHPDILECAVVGLPDETWGETVAVAVVLHPDAGGLALDGLHEWGRDRLSSYKLPRRLRIVDSLPRNAMGKVSKREITGIFAAV